MFGVFVWDLKMGPTQDGVQVLYVPIAIFQIIIFLFFFIFGKYS